MIRLGLWFPLTRANLDLVENSYINIASHSALFLSRGQPFPCDASKNDCLLLANRQRHAVKAALVL